jgi:hypothetical protein
VQKRVIVRHVLRCGLYRQGSDLAERSNSEQQQWQRSVLDAMVSTLRLALGVVDDGGGGEDGDGADDGASEGSGRSGAHKGGIAAPPKASSGSIAGAGAAAAGPGSAVILATPHGTKSSLDNRSTTSGDNGDGEGLSTTPPSPCGVICLLEEIG